MPAGPQLAVGMLVTAPGLPAVARVGRLDGQAVHLEFFDSAATPLAWQQWLDRSGIRRYDHDVVVRRCAIRRDRANG
jgi:hypothetical protein